MAPSSSLHKAVWETADRYLRGRVPRQDYGDYILPFTVLRRMEAILEPTKAEVLEFLIDHENDAEHIVDNLVFSTFGLPFYSRSPLSLAMIAQSDDSVRQGLSTYVGSFSSSVRDVFTSFDFDKRAESLEERNVLWGVVNHFAALDLSDQALAGGEHASAENVMGDLFENLMFRSFSENGQVAGEFYTPREVIRLMVDVLLSSDDDGLRGKYPARSVYDPAAGTGGMLLVAKNAIEELNPNAQVSLYGQELMQESFALGKSDLIVAGADPEAIKLGNTLIDDKYANQQFDYVLSNPPYGTDWKAVRSEVEAEAAEEGSRFSHGLPPVSDGQMLFLSHVVHKLKDAKPGTTEGGRAGVVTNGSPLFTGAAESGPDRIRGWLIEEDLIDAIIALPTSMFYNTGIATYVWILDKNKEPRRRGKIQLIDATEQWTSMRKSMGDKRRMFSEEDQALIAKWYADFEENENSKIVTAEDLSFYDVPMYRLKHYSTSVADDAVAAALDHKQVEPRETHEQIVRGADGVAWNDLPDYLKKAAKDEGVKMGVGLIGHIMKSLAVDDADAPVAVDHRGNEVVDRQSKFIERVPRGENIDEHMQREVLPFAPDMQWELDKAKLGYEIPMTRLFYKPEELPSLEELDAQIAEKLEEIRALFSEVREDE